MVELCFEDNGAGIDPEHQKRLFAGVAQRRILERTLRTSDEIIVKNTNSNAETGISGGEDLGKAFRSIENSNPTSQQKQGSKPQRCTIHFATRSW